ncbi:MAG: hypothetical protein R3C32_04755 [Chloroflexota bacterium]
MRRLGHHLRVLSRGTSRWATVSATAPVSSRAPATTPPHGRLDCAQAVQRRHDFDGWLSSSTTVAQPSPRARPRGRSATRRSTSLAVLDKAGPEHAGLLAALDAIVADMHADGTLTALSEKWYDGQDLTTKR